MLLKHRRIYMAPQQLTLRTDKKFVPRPLTQDDWSSDPTGLVFPTITDPVDDEGYYKWLINLDFDGGASEDVENNFMSYSQLWDHVVSPYNGSRPDGMYFFFGLHLYLKMPGSDVMQGATIYIGRGKSGSQNPWWVGGGGFTVSGDHKSGTMTYLGGVYCTNAKNIEIYSSGNVGEIDFYINKYTTS